jgi:hypothetical protein
MSQSKTFSLSRKKGAELAHEVAVLSVTAQIITGAEQDIVLLDEDGTAVAIVKLQPGVDRRQL